MTDNVSLTGTESAGDRPELFLRQLLSYETRIFSYILKLVPNFTDAEEIMQETYVIMWRKFAQFTPGTDFVAWAIQIAHYRILEYRRARYKSPLVYDNEVFEKMLSLAKRTGTHEDRRVRALKRCLTKLRERQRTLIRLRYYEGLKPKEIANRLGMSIHAVYKSLSRTHGQLLLCVKRTVVSER